MKISDHTCGYDTTNVSIKEADLRIDVFNYYDGKAELSQHLPLPNDVDQNVADESKSELPQAQVMSLPNRCLDGVWDR